MKIRLLVSLKEEPVNSGHCPILTTPENIEVFWIFQRVKKRNIDRFIFRVTNHSPEHYRIGSSEQNEVGLETAKAWCPRVRLFSSLWKILVGILKRLLFWISSLQFRAMRQSDKNQNALIFIAQLDRSATWSFLFPYFPLTTASFLFKNTNTKLKELFWFISYCGETCIKKYETMRNETRKI